LFQRQRQEKSRKGRFFDKEKYMKKEIHHFRNFSFFLKTDKELSKREKCQMHDLLIKMYPPFKTLFDKHGYYSTVKPQMEFLIKDGDKLIGTGKLLWRNVKIKGGIVKLFAFGMVVDKPYQKQGIGTELIRLNKKEVKKRKADLLYGSTRNQKVERMLEKARFEKLKVLVMYKDTITKKIKKERSSAYVFEFKKGLVDELNKLEHFYIGIGPI